LQDTPKFTQIGIFGLKICHLATLSVKVNPFCTLYVRFFAPYFRHHFLNTLWDEWTGSLAKKPLFDTIQNATASKWQKMTIAPWRRALWSSHPPTEQTIPGSNPARV
jgi:hypothetical protein